MLLLTDRLRPPAALPNAPKTLLNPALLLLGNAGAAADTPDPNPPLRTDTMPHHLHRLDDSSDTVVVKPVTHTGRTGPVGYAVGSVLAWACGAVPPPKPNGFAAACCAAGAGDTGEGLAVPPNPNGLFCCCCCCVGVAPPPPNVNPVAGAPPLAPPNGVAGNADGKPGEGPLAIVGSRA